MVTINDFNIDKLIGKGSYGSVYKATKKSDKCTYAIKKIKIINLNHYEKKYVINEIRILASHKCNNLLTYYNVLHGDNNIYIITEYAGHGDLCQLIKKHKSNNTTIISYDIWRYFIEISLGLHYLHKNNIIHRDIKSANIFIDINNTIKIGDFGIVKIMPIYMMYAQTQIGTPYYMAPEIYKNQRYSEKCDVWSLGCVLYEMIFLTTPFNGSNIYDLKYKIMTGKYNITTCKDPEHKLLIKSLLVINSYQRPSMKDILNKQCIISRLKKSDNITTNISPLFNEHCVIPQRLHEWKFIVDIFKSDKVFLPLITPNKVENINTALSTPKPIPPPPGLPIRIDPPNSNKLPKINFTPVDRISRKQYAKKYSKHSSPIYEKKPPIYITPTQGNKKVYTPIPPLHVNKKPKLHSRDNKLNNLNNLDIPQITRIIHSQDSPVIISQQISPKKPTMPIIIDISSCENNQLQILDKKVEELIKMIDFEKKQLNIKMHHLEHLQQKRKDIINKSDRKYNILHTTSDVDTSDNYTQNGTIIIKIGSKHETNHFLS